MTTSQLTTTPRASSPPEPQSGAYAGARPAAPASPAFGERLREILPLVEVIAIAGPPIILTAGVWVLFALMLVGPFAVLFTFTLVFVVAAVLVRLVGAIVAAPFLLVRHVVGHHRRDGRAHVPVRAPAARLASLPSR